MASRTVKVVLELKGEQKVSSGIKKQEKAVRNLNITIKNYGNAQRKAASDSERLRRASKGLTNQFIKVNLASRAISLGIHQMSSAFTFGVGAAIDFGFTIKKISAISSVAGAELKSLESTIKAIASVSPKTSTQVAQAALEMSKMGLAGKDLENSLAGVVNLSVALDEEVAAVGQTMLSVKNIFNKDASEMTAIADMMFTTLGNSALNLEKFSTAFAFAGASARLSGVSFEETSAMMGVLADNGIKASTIGTQLRQVFTRLDDPTSKVSKLLGEQSIKTRGLTQTLMILKGLIKDSGDAKKLFGQRAIGVIDILTRETGAISTLTGKIDEMQKSTEAAADMLSSETTKGALQRFKSAWELMFINLGESSNGFWAKFTGGAADAMKVIADSLDDTLTESEFVTEHVNKHWAELVKSRKFEDVRSLSPFLLANERKILEDEGKEAYKKHLKELQAIKEMEGKTSFVSGVGPSSFNMTADNNFNIPENLTAKEKEKADQKAADAAIKAIELKKTAALVAEKAASKEAVWALLRKQVSDSEVEKSKAQVKLDEAKNKANQEYLENLIEWRTIEKELGIESSIAFQGTILAVDTLVSSVDTLGASLAHLTLGGNLKEFGEMWKSFAKQMIADLIKMAVKMLLVKAISTSLGIGTGGIGFAGASAFSGALLSGLGGVDTSNPAPQRKASGFQGIVSQPTTFTVGEEGAEEVMVRPRAKMSAGSSKGAGMTVIIQGDINGEEQFIDRIRSANEEIERRSM